MSVVKIRAALETALNAMSPAIATAFENAAFNPPASSIPYQVVTMLFATPDNSEYGSRHVERGYMQVNLQYPLMVGTADIAARAELLRTTFKRGASFVNSGITVTIEKTPEVGVATADSNMYSLNVKIRFLAQIN